MALVLGGIGYFVIFSDSQEPYDENTDDTGGTAALNLAPDFTLPRVGGSPVTLSDLRGKIVVLDFMATEHAPCKTQNVHLKTISQQYNPNDVVILSITIDESESESQLLNYISDEGITWDMLRDTGGVSSYSDYSASSIPTLVIINRDGEIAFRNVGITPADDLAAEINDILIYG